MRRLGKRNNGLSIIMEGTVGKVMKGGKLLERVRFEEGDNLVEAVEKLKMEYLLEQFGGPSSTSDPSIPDRKSLDPYLGQLLGILIEVYITSKLDGGVLSDGTTLHTTKSLKSVLPPRTKIPSGNGFLMMDDGTIHAYNHTRDAIRDWVLSQYGSGKNLGFYMTKLSNEAGISIDNLKSGWISKLLYLLEEGIVTGKQIGRASCRERVLRLV